MTEVLSRIFRDVQNSSSLRNYKHEPIKSLRMETLEANFSLAKLGCISHNKTNIYLPLQSQTKSSRSSPSRPAPKFYKLQNKHN